MQDVTEACQYNWVWWVRNRPRPNSKEGESVPISQGDLLFISVCSDTDVRFSLRSRACPPNEAYWANAKAKFDSGKGTIEGSSGDRRFVMELKQNEYPTFSIVKCRHFRNPEEGEWDGDDGWDPTAQ